MVLFSVGVGLVIFLTTFRLFESPETWMDEGLIIQSAIGLLETGKAALPVAPGVFEPAWYITTGYPVTLPLAGVFALFGISLEAARLVMLLFLISFFVALLVYVSRSMKGIAAWCALYLLIFFAPIYGNGRNVLGEVPGIVFIILALLPLLKNDVLSRKNAIWIGVWAGLAVAAKPIFILFLPALLCSLLVRHKELNLRNTFWVGTVSVIAPLLLWVVLQFNHDALGNILAVYSNPHSVDIGSAIVENLKRLVTEMQPMYFFAALSLWVVSYVIRRLRHEMVSAAEEVALIFSVLVLLAYLRTAGYYRYFFPAQVFALLYLPQSFLYLFRERSVIYKHIAYAVLFGLIIFQMHATFFRSWVAVHFNATRTETLESYFETIPKEQEIFIYQAPEVVPFAPKDTVYQYTKIIPAVIAGKEYQSRVLLGQAPLVIAPEELFLQESTSTFQHYVVTQTIDRYVVLAPDTKK